MFLQQMFPVRANGEILGKQGFLNNVSSAKFVGAFIYKIPLKYTDH